MRSDQSENLFVCPLGETTPFLLQSAWVQICNRENLKQTSGSSAGTNCDKKPQARTAKMLPATSENGGTAQAADYAPAHPLPQAAWMPGKSVFTGDVVWESFL